MHTGAKDGTRTIPPVATHYGVCAQPESQRDAPPPPQFRYEVAQRVDHLIVRAHSSRSVWRAFLSPLRGYE